MTEQLAPITNEATGLIKKYAPNGVVEIGAGRGIWLDALEAAGIEVIGYDPIPGSGKVLKGDHKDAAQHVDKVMLAVWPPDGSIIQQWVAAANWQVMIICGCWARFDYELDLSNYDKLEQITLPGNIKGESELKIFVRKK